jgi:hypothetical protein
MNSFQNFESLVTGAAFVNEVELKLTPLKFI